MYIIFYMQKIEFVKKSPFLYCAVLWFIQSTKHKNNPKP
jgi:hypothetical protein